MRLFRRPSAEKAGKSENSAQHDPARQEILLQQIRQPLGRDEVVALLDGTDDGLLVAVRIVHAVAEEARADFSLSTLPCGFHPNTHLAAAATVLGGAASRSVRLTDPARLLANVLDLIHLTVADWERGKVSVDAGALMERLISAATQIRAVTGEPPLPPAIRELMRRNTTTDIYDPTGGTVVGGINVGAEMRKAFLT
jgi:hypothetical protein